MKRKDKNRCTPAVKSNENKAVNYVINIKNYVTFIFRILLTFVMLFKNKSTSIIKTGNRYNNLILPNK